MRWQRAVLPPLDLPCGYSLRSFRLCEDEPILTTLQNEAFGQNWGFSPNTVDQIRARVRVKRCDPDGIVFIVKDDMVAGYNWTLRSGSTGWVSMTGVSAAYRGRGLGQAVVLAGMHYLRSMDVEAITRCMRMSRKGWQTDLKTRTVWHNTRNGRFPACRFGLL